jgi:hypothetical protein
MKNFAAVSFIVLAVLVIVFGPLCTIWALNTLFALNIAYTFETWGAAIILTSIITGKGVSASFKAK